MKYSYRPPGLASKQPAAPELTPQESEFLVERRAFVRITPITAAVERTDEEVWLLWDQAVLGKKTEEQPRRQ
jgi:hypothetical protein